mmetsp:Transcript_25580/g.70385  ORF Transcript_25580/g.70385 Transcript_25580/m.70385 type:complete len:153 (+) Transcript_25580:430-888(+)
MQRDYAPWQFQSNSTRFCFSLELERVRNETKRPINQSIDRHTRSNVPPIFGRTRFVTRNGLHGIGHFDCIALRNGAKRESTRPNPKTHIQSFPETWVQEWERNEAKRNRTDTTAIVFRCSSKRTNENGIEMESTFSCHAMSCRFLALSFASV